MSTTLHRPSKQVAARRRRVLVWLPLLVMGAVASLAAGSMIEAFNSLDATGLILTTVGLLGYVSEVDN